MRTHFKSHKKKPWNGEVQIYDRCPNTYEKLSIFPSQAYECVPENKLVGFFCRIKKRIETVMTVCTLITLPTDVTNIFNKQNGKIMDVQYDNISKI